MAGDGRVAVEQAFDEIPTADVVRNGHDNEQEESDLLSTRDPDQDAQVRTQKYSRVLPKSNQVRT